MAGTRRERGLRRAEIAAAARQLFTDEPFGNVSMADVAAAGQVSRPSAYRYFPGGTAEVFVAVAEDVATEVRDRLHHAAQGPFSSTKRLEHLLAALFAYFSENPAAYRILFQDAWATRDADVTVAVAAARAQLAAEIAAVVSACGGRADDVVLVSAGILGVALANLEQVLAGTADAESAWRVTCSLAVSFLR